METKENSVFKLFIAVCIIISVGIIYILLIRPQKIVIESNGQGESLEFFYKESELNPPLSKLVERSKEGKHIVIVLLTPTKRLLANYDYDFLLKQFENCNGELPCKLITMDKEEYASKSKKRKDIKKGS